jgi:hypothetical protein
MKVCRKTAGLGISKETIPHPVGCAPCTISCTIALALLVCGAAICAGIGLALEAIPAYLSLLCYFLLFITHCLFVTKSEAIGAWLNARVGRPKSSPSRPEPKDSVPGSFI